MERLAYLTTGSLIDAHDLKLSSEGWGQRVADDVPLSEATRKFQIEYIERQIQLAAGI